MDETEKLALDAVIDKVENLNKSVVQIDESIVQIDKSIVQIAKALGLLVSAVGRFDRGPNSGSAK